MAFLQIGFVQPVIHKKISLLHYWHALGSCLQSRMSVNILILTPVLFVLFVIFSLLDGAGYIFSKEAIACYGQHILVQTESPGLPLIQ